MKVEPNHQQCPQARIGRYLDHYVSSFYRKRSQLSFNAPLNENWSRWVETGMRDNIGRQRGFFTSSHPYYIEVHTGAY